MNGQQQGVPIINEWRRKAFALSGSDVSMGSILSKSLDFMNTVVKNGLRAPNMNFAMDSLKHERDLAMEFDENKSEPLRDTVYGVVESIGAMVAELVEQNEQIMNTFNEFPAHQEPFDAGIGNENVDASNKLILETNFDAEIMISPKDEPVDETAPLLQDHVEKPFGDSGNVETDLKQEDNPILPADIDESMALKDSGMPVLQLEQQLDELDLQPESAPPSIEPTRDVDDGAPKEEKDDNQIANAIISKASRPRRSTRGIDSRKKVIGKGLPAKKVKSRLSIVMKRHKRSQNDSTKNLSCSICSKVLGSQNALRRHKATHNGRQFECPSCDYSSTRRDKLKLHCIAKHGVSPYSCSTCSTRFDKLKQLQCHWKVSGHRVEKTNKMLKRVLGK